MSQAKVKATRLKAARANRHAQSSHKLSQQQVLVDEESHNFRLTDTTSSQGSTILTVFHIKESKFDIDKRILTSRLPYQYDPYKRFADTTLYRQVLPIPLRPGWNNYSTRQELQKNEVEKFDQYLKVIYDSIPPSRLTHFEHNLDVWRQLWRVCEISDVLCACVDARHPLFHFPPALYDFIVKKHKKPLIVILNKIDLVPRTIINAWEQFLKRIYPDVHIIKFSSHPNPNDSALNNTTTAKDSSHASFLTDDSVRLTKGMSVHSTGAKQTGAGTVLKYQPLGSALLKTFWNIMSHIIDHQDDLPSDSPRTPGDSIVTNELVAFALDYARRIGANDDIMGAVSQQPSGPHCVYDLGRIYIPDSVLITDQMEIEDKMRRSLKNATRLNRLQQANLDEDGGLPEGDTDEDDEVDADQSTTTTTITQQQSQLDSEDDLDEIDTNDGDAKAAQQYKQHQNIALTIGMVGHPNAGKSSLINAILGRPAVSVSNTPGHTKHLQTLTTIPHCSKSIRLCDSPGIVFPAVDISRSLQTLLGIFPHPKLAEPYTCVQFLAERLPLVNIYQLKPHLGADSDGSFHGASHPGGDKTCFIEGYQDIILKTKYEGRPTKEELDRKLASIPSNTQNGTHQVFVDGTVTSTTPSMLTKIATEEGGVNPEATTTTTPTAPSTTVGPILVNGIDIAALAPTIKGKNSNNKKKGGKGASTSSNTSQQQVKEKTGNELFDTLDQLLVDDRFDQFTNPRFVWSSYRICESYAVKRGWFTESKPDTFKAGMAIIKDCVDGKLNLYFLPPRMVSLKENHATE